MACYLKTAGRRAKCIETWELGEVVISYMGYLSPFINVILLWYLYGVLSPFINVILGSFSALVSKWPVTWKWLTIERNWVKLGVRGSCHMYMGHLWPFSVLGHLGFIQCSCLKMACNSKIAGCRMKRSEIWESWVVVVCIWGTFDLLVLKVILGSFGALVSKWPVTRKWRPCI